MKLSKNKKIILLGTTPVVLIASVVTPIVLLNKNEKNAKNVVEKLFEILKAKTAEEKIIELPSSANGKIIANNKEAIMRKFDLLISDGESLLIKKGMKIEFSMKKDADISNDPQKIIIKLIKNQFSKEIKDFSVKKKKVVDENIETIKRVLDAKTSNDLIIILPGNSTGKIIENATNKNEILKKLRILIHSQNTTGAANHLSLRGTTIEVSMTNDAPISTTPQNIIVSISKTGGKTLRTRKIFKVKKESAADRDIMAIKQILDNKFINNTSALSITLPSSASGSIINNPTNKNAIERKVRRVIDSSNTNGEAGHASLRGTTITLTKISSSPPLNDLISSESKTIVITISKTNGTSLEFSGFSVKKM